MARYNTWQNDSLITVATPLGGAALTADRGAFFGSIQGTFSHLLWGDTIWMSRFDGGAGPGVGLDGSAAFAPDWAGLTAARRAMNARIISWADGLAQPDGDLSWFSGALGRDVTKPLALCITHFFNHQTHHRGQIHAMLTSAGAHPGDTDLFIMPEI